MPPTGRFLHSVGQWRNQTTLGRCHNTMKLIGYAATALESRVKNALMHVTLLLR